MATTTKNETTIYSNTESNNHDFVDHDVSMVKVSDNDVGGENADDHRGQEDHVKDYRGGGGEDTGEDTIDQPRRLEKQSKNQQQHQHQQQQPVQFCFENLPSDLSDSNHPRDDDLRRQRQNYLATLPPSVDHQRQINNTTTTESNRKYKDRLPAPATSNPNEDANRTNTESNASNRRLSNSSSKKRPSAAGPASSSRRLLSDDLMRYLSGIDSSSRPAGCCLDCQPSRRQPTSRFNTSTATTTTNTAASAVYNLQALQRTLSNVSPFVSGPMLLEEEEEEEDDDDDQDDKEDGDSDGDANAEELGDAAIHQRSQRINRNTNSQKYIRIRSESSSVVKTAEQLLMDYMVACQFYKVGYNAGVLTCLRFALPCLRVSGPFHDDDMLALVEVLLKHANTSLRHIIRLDFTVASKEGRRSMTHTTKSMMGFTSHGAFALAKLLQTTQYIAQVWLPRHRVGPYGASALFLACSQNPTIKVLNLRRCRIGEKGALAFCELILGQKQQQPRPDFDTQQRRTIPPQNGTSYSTSNYSTTSNKNYSRIMQEEEKKDQLPVSFDGESFNAFPDTQKTRRLTIGLVDVDLSANLIGHHGTSAIENALEILRLQKEKEKIESRQNQAGQKAEYDGRPGPDGQAGDIMFVNLEGNLVFPEILNGVTHGCGVLLSLIGGYALWSRVSTMSTWTHTISCTIYTFSLLVLYVSSTLYHSFFTLVNTRYVFQVMDKCAIYILIAGSYTPYLQILMNDRPEYSYGLLAVIWLCATLGISVEAMYPTWKWKNTFSLSMYLGMGWCAIICLPEIKDRIELGCIKFLVLGGVGYTAGVPFFVRNNNLDHAIWHLFVLSGSIFHWLGCYVYVASHPLPLPASGEDSCQTA